MIIVISGTAGAGKSTVAKLVAKRLGLKHYSIGDLTRRLAEKKGLSLLEFSKLQERDKAIDREIDQLQTAMGKKGDNFVIDSRLGFHFIPHARLKVFLDAKLEERAMRVWEDRRKDEKTISLKQLRVLMKRREKSEKIRYKKYYNLNPLDKKHYDLVLDTTELDIKEVVDRIIKRIK